MEAARQEYRMAGTRRPYLRQSYRYEYMLGTTFKSVGGYLDTCCLRNSDSADGCAVSAQCRRWWDKKCNRTRPELSDEEIVAIIAQFEEVREGWLQRKAPSEPARSRLPVTC
jgi:hypothetical protein